MFEPISVKPFCIMIALMFFISITIEILTYSDNDTEWKASKNQTEVTLMTGENVILVCPNTNVKPLVPQSDQCNIIRVN